MVVVSNMKHMNELEDKDTRLLYLVFIAWQVMSFISDNVGSCRA